MPGGSWCTEELLVHGTDSRQKMGGIGDVGKNRRDAAGDEIARVRIGISRGSDPGWSADAACCRSRVRLRKEKRLRLAIWNIDNEVKLTFPFKFMMNNPFVFLLNEIVLRDQRSMIR